MFGVVKKINLDKKLVIIQDDFGDYTVLEIHGRSDIEAGDEISGDFHITGDKILKNETKEEMFSVSVLETHVSSERAEQLLE
jgi:hypothetical protein